MFLSNPIRATHVLSRSLRCPRSSPRYSPFLSKHFAYQCRGEYYSRRCPLVHNEPHTIHSRFHQSNLEQSVSGHGAILGSALQLPCVNASDLVTLQKCPLGCLASIDTCQTAPSKSEARIWCIRADLKHVTLTRADADIVLPRLPTVFEIQGWDRCMVAEPSQRLMQPCIEVFDCA